MNLFEGGRRIAKIVYVLIASVGLLIAFGTNPYLGRYYTFDDNFDLISIESCGSTSWFIAKVEGRPDWASISVCGGLDGPKTMPLNKVELEKLDAAIYEERLSHYASVGVGTALAILGTMIAVWCIGWIVRGFMGIPKGQDRKSPGVAQQTSTIS